MQLKQDTKLQNGKYRIIRALGQGGFGITYLAKHTMLDKMVAIKEFFPKGYCDRNVKDNSISVYNTNLDLIKSLKKQFVKEAKIIAKFNHPNIIKVLDVFEENNTAYYVMEYIKGETLSDIVKRDGPLKRDYIIKDIRKIGKALRYIHKRRYLHLDVKPANIIIRKGDNEPILIDFGLSKHYNSNNKETTVSLPCFSNGFASIELYKPDGLQSFLPQVDIYALGATMYYLSTGIIPPDAISLTNRQKKLIIHDYIPQEFQTIIKRMMAISKSKPYNNINGMLSSLPKEGAKPSIKQWIDKKLSNDFNLWLFMILSISILVILLFFFIYIMSNIQDSFVEPNTNNYDIYQNYNDLH